MGGFKGLAKEQEVVELHGRCVGINSVNADLKDGRGEAELGRFVADYLAALGCQVSMQEVLPGRSNVIATLPVPGATKSVLLEAHLDTMPLEPMPDALQPRIVDGRVYGRGACDTKGSLAAMMYAMKLMSEHRHELRCQPTLMGSVDEEHKSRGIHAFVASMPMRLDGAVVGEPTNLCPAIIHKGLLRWRMRALGKAAHTSRPQEGNNAIYQMVELIAQLRAQIDTRLPAKAHPMAGPPVMTVSMIQGGTVVNMVPPECAIDIDRRTLPGELQADVLGEIDALVARLMRQHPDFNLVREEPFLIDPALDTPADSGIAQAVLRACRTITGPRELCAVPYGSDASKLQAVAGVPAVVLGPGGINQAHTADEWVEIRELVVGAELYAEICREF
jgi:acetylornithine deacetylase/succinyl-diaminopimelate desuccinylase-like protein